VDSFKPVYKTHSTGIFSLAANLQNMTFSEWFGMAAITTHFTSRDGQSELAWMFCLMALTTTYHARTLSRVNERSRSVALRTGSLLQSVCATIVQEEPETLLF